jgi:hypothetical protein
VERSSLQERKKEKKQENAVSAGVELERKQE